MHTETLTHQACVGLLRTPERGHYGIVTIDAFAAVPLACVVLDDGDLLIPTGEDHTLVQAASGRPVSVEFTRHDRYGRLCWSIRGIGLARPMRRPDLPRPLPHSTVLTAGLDGFGSGIRLVTARLTGYRMLTEIPVPAPRAGDGP